MDGQEKKTRIVKVMFKWVVGEEYKKGARVVPIRLSAGAEVVYGPGDAVEARQEFWSPAGYRIMFSMPPRQETSFRRSALIALRKHLEQFGVEAARIFQIAQEAPATEAELKEEEDEEGDGEEGESGA